MLSGLTLLPMPSKHHKPNSNLANARQQLRPVDDILPARSQHTAMNTAFTIIASSKQMPEYTMLAAALSKSSVSHKAKS